MAAQVKNERARAEEAEFHFARPGPVTNDWDVSRLSKRHHLIARIEDAIAVGIENPGSSAENARPLDAGACPVTGDGDIARLPVGEAGHKPAIARHMIGIDCYDRTIRDRERPVRR